MHVLASSCSNVSLNLLLLLDQFPGLTHFPCFTFLIGLDVIVVHLLFLSLIQTH